MLSSAYFPRAVVLHLQNMKYHKSWQIVFLILAALLCPIECNSVCEASAGSSLDWETAGLIIANTIIGEIPVVGPWLEAFEDISEQVSKPGYSKDITDCVEGLIEQKLDERVIKSTETFLSWPPGMSLPWNPTFPTPSFKWWT